MQSHRPQRRISKAAVPAGDAGFSTIEALVAIAILSAALIPILSFQSQQVSSALRLERQAERHEVEHVARAYIQLLDFESASEGKLTMGGGWTLVWSTTPISERREALYGLGLRSRFATQQLEVSAQLLRDGQREFDFQAEALAFYEIAPYSN